MIWIAELVADALMTEIMEIGYVFGYIARSVLYIKERKRKYWNCWIRMDYVLDMLL